MTITLPDEMRRTLEARAKATGFGEIDDYVEEIVANDQIAAGLGAPATQDRMSILLDEAFASGPAAPIVAEFWDRLDSKVAGRLGNG